MILRAGKGSAGLADHRGFMSRVAAGKTSRADFQDAHPHCHEHIVPVFGANPLVHMAHYFSRRAAESSGTGNQLNQQRFRMGRLRALPVT